MNIKTSKILALLVVALSLLSLAACGADSGAPYTGEGSGSYTVYMEGMAGGSLSKSAVASGQVVVLPSTANAPYNYHAVSSARVTFLQEEMTSDADSTAGSLTVTTDSGGRFNLPEEIRAASQGGEGGVDVVVSPPGGGEPSISTSLPAAEDDNGETPVSLRVVPDGFRMLPGTLRAFYAVKITPGGNAVKARNASWDCDPEGTGVLAIVEEATNGEYVICRAQTPGEAAVSASINAGGGLSNTARGEVVSGASLIAVKGTVSHPSGNVVGAGFLVSFNIHEPGRIRPLRFAGHTDGAGSYSVLLPGAQDTDTYAVVIGTPVNQGARLHRAEPFTITVYNTDNGIALVQDFSIGEPLPPLPPRPPLARIVRAAWHQVDSAVRPRFFEPFNCIRELFSEPDGQGQVVHPGMFHGWCYDKSGETVTITPPDLYEACPNPYAHGKIQIARAALGHYLWTAYLRLPLAADYVMTATGEVQDTVFYSPAPETSYISDIAATVRHRAPFSGMTGFTSTWDWTRTLGGDTGNDSEVPETVALSERVCSGDNEWTGVDPAAACGEGMPLLTHSLTREREASFTDFSLITPLFTFYGNGSHFVRHPDGSLRQVDNTMCDAASPCILHTDGSGSAEVASTDGRVDVLFTLLPFGDPNIATGTLTLKVRTLEGTDVDRVFLFTINRFGFIFITRPDATQVEQFVLPVS